MTTFHRRLILQLEPHLRWFLDLFDAGNISASPILPYLRRSGRHLRKYFRLFPHGDFFNPLRATPQTTIRARSIWPLDLFHAANPLVPSISPCLHWSVRYRENHFRIFRSIGRLARERESISVDHRYSAAIKDTVDISSHLERDRTDWPT